MEPWKLYLLGFASVILLFKASSLYAREKATFGLVQVRSTVDGQNYRVLDVPNKQEAADVLATVKQQAVSVLKALAASDDSAVPQKFRSNITCLTGFQDNTTLAELDPLHEQTVAYTLNKQDVFLCTRRYANMDEIVSTEVLLVVYLHELVHTCLSAFSEVSSEGHTIHSAEFKELENVVVNAAINLGFVSPTKAVGEEYCGIIIPSSEAAQ
jgi:hypothetical protein